MLLSSSKCMVCRKMHKTSVFCHPVRSLSAEVLLGEKNKASLITKAEHGIQEFIKFNPGFRVKPGMTINGFHLLCGRFALSRDSLFFNNANF